MTDLEQQVYDTIRDIIQDKQERKKHPVLALYTEILGRLSIIAREDVKTALNALIKNKHITWGHTINDIWLCIN